MIRTDRLRMRLLEESDVPSLQAIWGDPQVMAFCGGATREDCLLPAVQQCLASQRVHGYSPLAVRIRESDALIGVCGLKPTQDPAGAELIYHFLPAAWGHGFATECVRALLARAAGHLHLSYVEASFDERNAASGKVLVKAGFTPREERWFEDVQRWEPVYRAELREARP